MATLEVLAGQFRRYDTLPTSLAELTDLARGRNHDWVDPDGRFIWVDGVACFGFGEHNGRTVADLQANEPDYLDWMAAADFSEAATEIIRAARAGIFPTPEIEVV